MDKIIPDFLGMRPDSPDERDYVWEEKMGALPPDMPTFEQGFDVEAKWGALKDDPQGSSYSCVAHGGTSDVEMSIKVQTQQDIVLSPRDAYSQIFQGGGGASPRDFYKLAKDKGICEDSFLPTRPNGQPLTEAFARKKDDKSVAAFENAAKWRIGDYFSIKSLNIDAIAQAIYVNYGCGGGYVPQNGDMGHFIWFRGYGMRKGVKALLYRDSYSPFTKWLLCRNGNYFLDDWTPVDLFSVWTFEPGNWEVKPKTTYEITIEQIAKVLKKRADLREVFPPPRWVHRDNPNYTIYDWAAENGKREEPEIFDSENHFTSPFWPKLFETLLSIFKSLNNKK